MEIDNEVQPLPPYFHAWGTKPTAIIRNKLVVFKSVPVIHPEESFKPDINSICFPITGTNLVGCCLCDKEMVAGKSYWGFKSHCFFAHPYLCNYKDLSHHNISFVRMVEAAYNEALDEVGTKRKITSFFGASTRQERNDTFREVVAKCVCLNLLPFTFPSSPGFNLILTHLNRSNEGLSAKMIVYTIKDMYKRMKRERFQAFIATFDIKSGVDNLLVFEEKHKRICSLSHDLFTSAVGNMPMLALNLHYMNTGSSPWELVNFLLGCTEMPPPHTAANVLAAIKRILAFWRIPITVVIAAVQDTTGNSLNVFNSVDTADVVPCFGHTNQLCMGHSVKDVASILEAFKKMSANNAKIKGKPKRIEAVSAAGLALGPPAVLPVPPMLHSATRWDIYEKVADNFFHNLPCYLGVNAAAVFDKADVRVAWQSGLDIIVREQPVIQLIQPFLKLCAQWTQILSSRTAVTISLVRLSIRSMRGWEISARDTIATMHDRGQQAIADRFEVYVDALRYRQDEYFGDDYYNSGLFRIAEFLDPRTIWALEDKTAFESCLELLKTQAPAEATYVPIAARAARREVAAPGGSFLSGYVPPQPAGVLRQSPIDLEIRSFISYLQLEFKEAEAMKCNPLEFWAEHSRRFPILAAIAGRVLSIPPTEAECERTFSIAGRVHSKARNKLSGEHINQVVCLHQWLHMDEQLRSRASLLRAETTTKKSLRFAQIQLHAELGLVPEPANVVEEFDEDDD